MKRELSLLKEVESPFICNLIGFYHDVKKLYICLEYVLTTFVEHIVFKYLV